MLWSFSMNTLSCRLHYYIQAKYDPIIKETLYNKGSQNRGYDFRTLKILSPWQIPL